jgi:hypothetical protein
MLSAIRNQPHIKLYSLIILAVFLNVGLWVYSNKQKIIWPNVPMAPKESSFRMSFLDDGTFAYRSFAMVLQNWGNVGGDVQPLKNYNFEHLAGWFYLMDKMDPRSSYVPFMAAYYFSATQNKEQLPNIINYLADIGSRTGVEVPEGSWRWLVQAIYLAKNEMNDQKRALELAEALSSIYRPSMPAWTKSMKEIIRSEMGDKELAYATMIEILRSNAKYMDPAEVNYMVSVVCERILTSAQAKLDPICKTLR